MSVDSGLCTVARLLTNIQKGPIRVLRLDCTSNSLSLSVVSNFRRSLRVASPRNFARARVYFARPTIAIAKIRDYSQCKLFTTSSHMTTRTCATSIGETA